MNGGPDWLEGNGKNDGEKIRWVRVRMRMEMRVRKEGAIGRKACFTKRCLWLPVSVRAGLSVAKPQGAPVGGGKETQKQKQASEQA